MSSSPHTVDSFTLLWERMPWVMILIIALLGNHLGPKIIIWITSDIQPWGVIMQETYYTVFDNIAIEIWREITSDMWSEILSKLWKYYQSTGTYLPKNSYLPRRPIIAEITINRFKKSNPSLMRRIYTIISQVSNTTQNSRHPTQYFIAHINRGIPSANAILTTTTEFLPLIFLVRGKFPVFSKPGLDP